MSANVKVASALSVVVLLATIFSLSSEPLPAEQTASATPSISNDVFKGKIVLVRVDRSSALERKTSSNSLTGASVEEIGGRFFLVGTEHVPDDPDYHAYEAMRGVTTGIAWEKVLEFHIFTEEQNAKYLKWWKESKEE